MMNTEEIIEGLNNRTKTIAEEEKLELLLRIKKKFGSGTYEDFVKHLENGVNTKDLWMI